MNLLNEDCAFIVPSIDRITIFKRNSSKFLGPYASKTYVIVPDNQVEEYAEEFSDYNIVGHPDDIDCIGKVRQYAIDKVSDARYLYYFDDDLRIATRDPDTKKTALANDNQVEECLELLYSWMSEPGVAQTGIGSSYMCQKKPRVSYNQMCGMAFLIDTHIMKEATPHI